MINQLQGGKRYNNKFGIPFSGDPSEVKNINIIGKWFTKQTGNYFKLDGLEFAEYSMQSCLGHAPMLFDVDK